MTALPRFDDGDKVRVTWRALKHEHAATVLRPETRQGDHGYIVRYDDLPDDESAHYWIPATGLEPMDGGS